MNNDGNGTAHGGYDPSHAGDPGLTSGLVREPGVPARQPQVFRLAGLVYGRIVALHRSTLQSQSSARMRVGQPDPRIRPRYGAHARARRSAVRAMVTMTTAQRR